MKSSYLANENTLKNRRPVPHESKQASDESPPPVKQANYHGFFHASFHLLHQCLGARPMPNTTQLPLDALETVKKLFQSGGTGLGELIEMAGKAALTEDNPSGRCQWPLGLSSKFLLLTDPQDIKNFVQLEAHHEYDVTGIFELGFGGKTLFSLPLNDIRRRSQRAHLMKNLYSGASLTKNLSIMKTVVTKALNDIQLDRPTPLYQLANYIALDIISGTQLGVDNLSDDGKDRIAEVISRIIAIIANPSTHVRLKLSQWLPTSMKNCILPTKLFDEAEQIIREEILIANPSAREKIAELWTDDGRLTDQILMTLLKMIIVAGHETTTKLLFFSIMILGDPDHSDILKKITAEIQEKIEETGKQLDEWQPHHYLSLPYLKAFMYEVLRLYPPIPDMLFGIEKRVNFNGGTLNVGDVVVISPRITHKMKNIFGDDADLFNPERFLNLPAGEPFNFCYFPFGMADYESRDRGKLCPGRDFARLETAVCLVSIISKFNFAASHKACHQTDYYQRATMNVTNELEHRATLTISLKDKKLEYKQEYSPRM